MSREVLCVASVGNLHSCTQGVKEGHGQIFSKESKVMSNVDQAHHQCAHLKNLNPLTPGPGSATVWNPSTRIFKELPRLRNRPLVGTFITYGFGYDNLADRYKVVAVLCYETDSDTGGYKKNKTDAEFYRTQVQVHTLGTHAWREIQDFPSCVPFTGTGKFLNGTLNWLVSHESNWFINSLNLGKESYQKLLPPDDGNEPENFLGVLKDCLCVLCGDALVWNVWLMKEYGNQKSWTKLFSVATELLPHYKGLRAIHISEDDQVLVVKFCSELFLYNSRDGTLKSLQIQIPDGCISLFSGAYVESLISPCF